MSISAIVEKDTIKLPIHVPDGTRVEILLPATSTQAEAAAGSFFDTIRDLVGSAEDLPADFAAEHDHYIHGTPKRTGK